MDYLSALSFWGDPQASGQYPDLLQALLSQTPQPPDRGNTGQDPGPSGYSRGTQFAPPDLPSMAEPDLPPGWLNNPAYYEQGSNQMGKVNLADRIQNPIVSALINMISPIPGTSSAVNRYADYWLNQNVGSGNTAYALGLGYADEAPRINPQQFYRDPGNIAAQRYSEPRQLNMSAFNRIWGK